MAQGERVLIFLCASLIISSVMAAWFLMQIFGISVSGIDLPSASTIYPSNQDFRNNNINTTIIYTTGAGITYTNEGNEWEYKPNIGRVLTQPNPIGNPLLVYLMVDNIKLPDSGIITNEYIINNTVKSDYSIILRYTGGYDQNEIIVKQDGFHIPTYILPGIIYGEKAFFPYSISSSPDISTIKTIYNDKEHSVNVYYNNVFVFSSVKLSEDQNILGAFNRFYGGVGGYKTGFTVMNFNTQNVITESASTTAGLTNIVAFVITILKITVWNIDPAFLPWELNIALIKTQEIGIMICVAYVLRS